MPVFSCTWAPPSSCVLRLSPVANFTSGGPAMPIEPIPRTIGTKSASEEKLAGPAKPGPSMAVTCGTQPDISTWAGNVPGPPKAKDRLSRPSWIRWPPPSSSITNGRPWSSASSVIRTIFASPACPMLPPMTVKSLAMIAVGRPFTAPIAVTTPSAGASTPARCS